MNAAEIATITASAVTLIGAVSGAVVAVIHASKAKASAAAAAASVTPKPPA